jgi:predicted Rossmann fold flavoprotein
MGPERSQNNTITVIGGGPSGMTAAIFAARQNVGKVRLIEKNAILGRKLLATGNGRCNLTNTNSPDSEVSLGFFMELGLLMRVEEEGRVYPYSEQASAVQEALISELQERQVEVRCGIEVKTMEREGSSFRIITDREQIDSDAVILATGGKAGPQYGSTGDGYRFGKAFGHQVIRLMPSLVQMVSDEPFFKELKGVRAKGQVRLMRGEDSIDCETGEIQFTEDGLSGICIFNLSKEYKPGDRVKIDLFPNHNEQRLTDIMERRIKTLVNRTAAQFFNGILPKKLIPVILAELSINENRLAGSFSKDDIDHMVRLVKSWDISVTGTKGWKEAQVTAGGIDLTEVDPRTMESILIPNLYFAGELLDVDGKCGGYNLQWAWTSGMKAGIAAALKGSKNAQDS